MDSKPVKSSNLLANRNFILLLAAYAVSAMGDHLSEMAILKTQNALSPEVDVTPLYARMTFVFFLPFLLFSPITGWLADKLPRRGLMVVADLARVAILFFFASLITWSQSFSIWGPILPLFLVGAFAAVFSPARSAMLPTLIEPTQLIRANGFISGLGFIATMAAAVIGGYLADHYEPMLAFRIDAGTFVVSAIILALLRPPKFRRAEASAVQSSNVVSEVCAGFRYVWCHRHVRELLIVAAIIWLCLPLVNSVIPAVVRDVYHGTYTMMSSFRAIPGAGLILGAIIIIVFGDALRAEIAMTWGLVGLGAALLVFAISTLVPTTPATAARIGAVGVFFAGLFTVAVMASFNSLLQRTVANRFRGRVFGVKDLTCIAALLLATGSIGIPQWKRVDQWVAWILLAVVALTFFAGFTVLRIRLQRGARGPALTWIENLNEFFSKFYWRLRRVGRCTVPLEGAVIIVSNHTCSADPSLLSAALPYRSISFMVAAEYATQPIVRSIVKLLECIPVKRNSRDAGSMKAAMRHLRAGKAMGIFIEGKITPPDEIVEPKEGAAMLALKTGTPVIPAFIAGTKYHDNILPGLLARHNVTVHFGPPVDLGDDDNAKPTREQIQLASQKIYQAIKSLAPTESRGTEE